MTTLEISISMAERGDATAARALVDDIGRRGLHEAYATELDKIVMGTNADEWDKLTDALWIWALVTATPAQIAAAYREAAGPDNKWQAGMFEEG